MSTDRGDVPPERSPIPAVLRVSAALSWRFLVVVAALYVIGVIFSRLAALERLLDQNPRALDSAKQMVKCNESLSVCIDSITAIRARVRG